MKPKEIITVVANMVWWNTNPVAQGFYKRLLECEEGVKLVKQLQKDRDKLATDIAKDIKLELSKYPYKYI